MNERPVQFGDGGRVFGMLTEPSGGTANEGQGPVFIILSAGMLHRVGPSRMHIPLAHSFAELGFPVLRIDLAGKGDSPVREGLKNQPSVAADFTDILAGIKGIYPNAKLVLFGMCSGADNAIRLSIMEPSVIGTVLLDPVCPKDSSFQLRALRKFLDPYRYLHRLAKMFRKSGKSVGRADNPNIDWLQFRDLPTFEQFQNSFRALKERNGAMLAVFTQDAVKYYNKQGQLEAVLDVGAFGSTATELFWPETQHTWQLSVHRRRLIDATKKWAEENFGSLLAEPGQSRDSSG